MTKTERYERALELINKCVARDKLIQEVGNMDNISASYIKTDVIENHNKSDMDAVMGLIDKRDLKHFLEKQLSSNERIPNMSQRYIENNI